MPALRSHLVLLTACAVLAASSCGGSDAPDRRLITQSRAEALLRSVDRVEGGLAEGDCPRAGAGVDALRTRVQDLPEATDGRLVTNLTQWVDHLEARVLESCEAASEEPTAEPTPSATPEEPTETPSPSRTPDATPTPAPTPDEAETPDPTPEPEEQDPPDTGGTAPEDEG